MFLYFFVPVDHSLFLMGLLSISNLYHGSWDKAANIYFGLYHLKLTHLPKITCLKQQTEKSKTYCQTLINKTVFSMSHLSCLILYLSDCKYDIIFILYLWHVCHRQICYHICLTFVTFGTWTNMISDLSHICLAVKHNQIHYFIQC